MFCSKGVLNHPTHSVCSKSGIGVAAVVAGSLLPGAASAKTFIDYIKPTPTVCQPLSSATWGVAGVLPRDICNGIEDAKGAAVPPGWFYWDGQILKAKDGKYHMFMSTWEPLTVGFQRWSSSDAYHAISDQGVLGPYKRKDYVYTNNGSHRGHNISALELPDGTYAVVTSEITAFTIYKSSSLDGPWTGCVAKIDPNGIKTSSDVACPAGGACNDTHWDSNVSLFPRHDGKFQIVQRHGFIAIADTLCGPYKMQKPTWTYPTANLPNVDSIYPKRTSNPVVTNPTYGWEEDPHIWRSGGVYHVLYSGSGDRVGWHLYSTDGIHDWKDGGLAYTPRQAQKMFTYEGTTTATQWFKCERPGVLLENGHPTHITLAVADVDKDFAIPAGSNHGSKVLVIPFDGVTFDNDYGVSGTGGTGGTGAGGSSSTGGAASTGGAKATGGSSSAGGSKATAGTTGNVATGGTSSTGGSNATGGTSSIGGSNVTGGSPTSGTVGGATTIPIGTGGKATTGGVASTPTGGVTAVSTATGGSSVTVQSGGALALGGATSSGGALALGGATSTPVAPNDETTAPGGCGCRVTDKDPPSKSLAFLGALGLLVLRLRRQRLRQ